MSDFDDEREAARREQVRKSLESAKPRRVLAWELLKQSRNPTYVAMRYGYTVAAMEEALRELERREAEKE